MIISHSNIERSFYKYISENIVLPYDYAVSYGNLRFKTTTHNIWLTLAFEEMGAGARTYSPMEIDVVSRVIGEEYSNDETIALDRLRDKLTNVITPLYDFEFDTPVLISNEKLIVKNADGRFTVDRIVLDNLKEGDLADNLRRSSVFLRVMLLTDTVGGRVI
jgi:hypothetical protein